MARVKGAMMTRKRRKKGIKSLPRATGVLNQDISKWLNRLL